MEKQTEVKNRAYKVGEFYVKEAKMNINTGEYDYQLTTDVNDCLLMTEQAAKMLHKCNTDGQIRIINTINK